MNSSHDAMVTHNMRRGMLRLMLSSTLTLSMLTRSEPIDFLFAVLSSSLNVSPLALFMVFDMLLIAAGYWLASALNAFLTAGALLSNSLARLYSGFGRVNRSINKKGLVSLSAALLMIVLWYVPQILDAVLLQYTLHRLMYLSMLFAGVLIFVGFRRLSSNMRHLSYLLGCKIMVIFGAYLLVSPVAIYNYFPYYEQAEAGAAMVAMCIASDATILPLWLRRYFSGK